MWARRRWTLVVAACSTALFAAACGSTGAAGDDGYPTESIRMVIPYSPGGPTDTTGRAIAAGMEKALGQPVVVVNKPGASGVVALSGVAQARADGYTIAYTTNSPLFQPVLRDTAYTMDDFKGVLAVLGGSPEILVASAQSPWKTAEDLAASGKSIKYGVSGIGTVPHFNSVVIFDALGIEGTAVPFEGWEPAVKAVLSGDIDAVLVDPQTALPYVESGDLRVLGTSRASGVDLDPALSSAPNFEEMGLDADALVDSYYGVIVPADTPKDQVEALRNAVAEAKKTDKFQKLADQIVKPILDKDAARSWYETTNKDSQTIKRLAEQLGLELGG